MDNQVDLGRLAFKYFNYFMVFLWRLGMGKLLSAWPEVFGQYMVITHHGRKSGREYRTPVNYAEVNGEIYCTAGFGKGSDWYRNILTNPQVEIWLPDGWYVGSAEELKLDAVSLPLLRSVLVHSGFAAYMAGANPKEMSDESILELCKEYRLIHIRRSAPRTGSDGPGDLAWVWPVAMAAVAILCLTGRKKK